MNRTPQPIRLFLVRHGEAAHNLNMSILQEGADCNSGLTPKGWKQAIECGTFLKRYFAQSPPVGEIVLLTSSYARCLETTQGIFDSLGNKISDAYQVHAFVEQNFGDLSGVHGAEVERIFPDYANKVTQHQITEATFFLRPPGGESLQDVCTRVRVRFGDIHRWHERGATDFIIVSHSRTIRCIALEWLNLDYKTIFQEPPPRNCAIRLIDRGCDQGYIFVPEGRVPGFEPLKTKTLLESLRAGAHRPPNCTQ